MGWIWVLIWMFFTPSCAKWLTRRKRFRSCPFCSISCASIRRRPFPTWFGTRPKRSFIGHRWWNRRKNWLGYCVVRRTPRCRIETSRAVVASHANNRSTWPYHRPAMEAELPLACCLLPTDLHLHHLRHRLQVKKKKTSLKSFTHQNECPVFF